MTDLAVSVIFEAQRVRWRTVPILAAGLFGGFTLGIIARAWMRLIAEDPEFTWSGTIFIVAGFTIFGFTQSIAAIARWRTRRRWTLTVARVVGAVGSLPLFVGAGAVMLPTVVGGGLALTRVEWRRFVRVVCVVAAVGPLVFVTTELVGSFGYSLHTAAGFLAMLALYGTIVTATRYTIAAQTDGWQLSRKARIAILVILGLVVVYASVGVIS